LLKNGIDESEAQKYIIKKDDFIKQMKKE